LLSTTSLNFVRRSEISANSQRPTANVLLLDTIGELSRIYRFGTVAFVGGSLVRSGGHNPIEPAAAGIPVCFGPHMSNFREIAATFLHNDAAMSRRIYIETPANCYQNHHSNIRFWSKMGLLVGVASRIADVRQAMNRGGHPALLMVDTISSLASIDYRHDEWEVDVTVAGSQKGLMLPPGLSFNAISDKALAAAISAGKDTAQSA